jgi:hypothetical protein
MTTNTLYQIIHDTLNIIPQDVLDHIIFPYIIYRPKHKYTIETNTLYHDIHFNKQLGILLCIGYDSYKLIDYHTGKQHDSSLIETISITPLSLRYANIIYFDSNILLIYYDGRLFQYVLHNKKYLLIRHEYMGDFFRTACVHNTNIYILNYRMPGDHQIHIYDFFTLNYIRKSTIFTNCYYAQQISSHRDIAYVIESISGQCYNRNKYDLETLDCTSHKFTVNESCKNIKLNKNRIYVLNTQTITVYDAKTLDAIYTLIVQPLKNNYTYLSVSNDIIILSNKNEIIVYE